jgi:hypothetical protein
MTIPSVPRGLRLLVVLVAIVAVLAACSGGAALAPAGGQAGNPVGNPGGAPAGQVEGDQSNGGSNGGTGSGGGSTAGGSTTGKGLYDVNRPDLLIIKTGNLSLQVAKIDNALAAASSKIASLGGYVSGSDRKGDGDQLVATAIYRIPAAQWDAALVALRGLADEVLGESTQTRDVTGDVLDLGARVANLQATEAALQAIMAKATKITDVLEVQKQLTDVRGQIEQLSTQKKHLEAQAAYSTLTVAYQLKPAAAVITSQKKFDPNTEVDKASASLVDVLQALATAGIWFAIVWLPILVALSILAAIVLVILRRFVPRRSILPAPTEGQP